MAQAPRGSASSAPESPAIRTAATELGPEELQAREKERSEFKAKAKNFELDWEAERVKKVEAGKEQIAMQVGSSIAAVSSHSALFIWAQESAKCRIK